MTTELLANYRRTPEAWNTIPKYTDKFCLGHRMLYLELLNQIFGNHWQSPRTPSSIMGIVDNKYDIYLVQDQSEAGSQW